MKRRTKLERDYYYYSKHAFNMNKMELFVSIDKY